MSNLVSDEDALRALLSSAEARDRERSGEGKSNRGPPVQRKRWGEGGRGGDNNTNNTNHPYKRARRTHDNERNQRNNNEASYYGPQGGGGGGGNHGNNTKNDEKVVNEEESSQDKNNAPPKQKANFGLSGALTKDEGGGGNVYKGVVLKFREPPEARCPNTQWRFYLFKGKDLMDTLHISKQSAYLMGRNADIADIHMAHPSLSSQHAVLQYRAMPTKDGKRLSCQPYIMDLESTNGTFINGIKIDSAKYYQLKKGDVLKFGASTREYVLMTENTTSIN